jgi:hypothetical protein
MLELRGYRYERMQPANHDNDFVAHDSDVWSQTVNDHQEDLILEVSFRIVLELEHKGERQCPPLIRKSSFQRVN